MRTVPLFEARLLRILHAFLRRAPREQALALILERCPQPPCLTRPGVELIRDSLAKGCMAFLARSGGWRRERHLRGDKVAEGRLWERSPPAELGLAFSGQSMRFLIWITAARPADHKPRWVPVEADCTPADLLLFYLAYTALRDTEVAPLLWERGPFAANALVRLAYPEDFADRRGGPEIPLGPWTRDIGAAILEALERELADRWVATERDKGRIGTWQRLRDLGHAQEAVLTRFVQAVDEAGRPDLARFLLRAAAALLTPDAAAGHWVGGLQGSGPRLADRADTYRAALAFLRTLDELRRWEARARGVGYIDEGYAAAQLWKAEWERWGGETLHSRAQAIIRQLDPMNLASGRRTS